MEIAANTGTPTLKDQTMGGTDVVLAQGGGETSWCRGCLVMSSLLALQQFPLS